MSTNTAPKEYIILPGLTEPPTEGTTLWGVRQDKGMPPRERIASTQPAPVEKVVGARRTDTKANRTQKRSTSRKTVKVTLWVPPSLKAELERLAEKERISISKVGGTLLEEAIRKSIHSQYGALMQPMIEQAIRAQMRGISTRLALLLVRVAFDTGQTRHLVTNILARQPGMNPTLLREILDGSNEGAKRSIKTRTPQLNALIEEVETWLNVQEGSGDKKDMPA